MSPAAKACVIGWPVAHSRSPLIHRYWLDHYGIDGEYTREPVAPDGLEAFIAGMAGAGFAGCNVTVPHKEAVMQLVDERDEAARAIGAANTLWFADGLLHAANTDSYGFLANLDERAPGWDERAGPAAVLGAGGAARAVCHGLAARGVREIRLLNRTRARADALAARWPGTVTADDWDTRDAALVNCALLVNTTTLGMAGAPPLDIDLSALPAQAVVNDLVYAPLVTPLLARAEARGFGAVDGLGMLLHQAAPGFETWFGVRPAVTAELRARIEADLAANSC